MRPRYSRCIYTYMCVCVCECPEHTANHVCVQRVWHAVKVPVKPKQKKKIYCQCVNSLFVQSIYMGCLRCILLALIKLVFPSIVCIYLRWFCDCSVSLLSIIKKCVSLLPIEDATSLALIQLCIRFFSCRFSARSLTGRQPVAKEARFDDTQKEGQVVGSPRRCAVSATGRRVWAIRGLYIYIRQTIRASHIRIDI